MTEAHMRTPRQNRAAVLLALALLGFAVAFYDSYVIYNGQLLWCPPPSRST
jgi:hypothetical protein